MKPLVLILQYRDGRRRVLVPSRHSEAPARVSVEQDQRTEFVLGVQREMWVHACGVELEARVARYFEVAA